MRHRKNFGNLTIAAPRWISLPVGAVYLFIWYSLLSDSGYSFVKGAVALQKPVDLILILLVLGGGSLMLLMLLFERTTLTKKHIYHRNLFLRTTKRVYRDIRDIQVSKTGDVLLFFRDGSRITIRTGERQAAQTIAYLRRHVDFTSLATRSVR